MRPELLNPLFAEVETLKGVGPQVAKQLVSSGLPAPSTCSSIFPPDRSSDFGRRAPRRSCSAARSSSTSPRVRFATSRGRGPTRIHAVDGEGNMLTLAFFQQRRLGREAASAGRDTDRHRQARGLWRRVADGPSRGDRAGQGQPALKETVYPLTEGLTTPGPRAGHRRRWNGRRPARMDRALVLAPEGWRDWRDQPCHLHAEPADGAAAQATRL